MTNFHMNENPLVFKMKIRLTFNNCPTLDKTSSDMVSQDQNKMMQGTYHIKKHLDV
jgi:hypothetical protein